jgi:hypothetical protein
VLMHALAASCEELRARTGNPPLLYKMGFTSIAQQIKILGDSDVNVCL